MKCDVFWSLFCVPIGLVICFGPAMLVWMLIGSKAPGSNPDAKDPTGT